MPPPQPQRRREGASPLHPHLQQSLQEGVQLGQGHQRRTQNFTAAVQDANSMHRHSHRGASRGGSADEGGAAGAD